MKQKTRYIPLESAKLYISDITEDQPWSASMGQSEVLVAGQKDKNNEKIDSEKANQIKYLDNEKVGNQNSEYYKGYHNKKN